MKKMNAILAAITLAVTAITPLVSSATELNLKTGKDTMTVSKTYDASYELKIPDTELYDLVEGEGFDVTATGFLHVNEKMIISVESDNDWHIEDVDCPTNQIKYDVSVDSKKIEDKKADIFEVAYNDEGQTKTVTMKIDKIDDPTYAGTYTDKLTFSARAVDIPKTDDDEVVTPPVTSEPETPPTTSSETETAPATTTTETITIVDGGGDNKDGGDKGAE